MTLGDFVEDTYVGGRRYVVYIKNIVTKITRKMWVTMVVGGYMNHGNDDGGIENESNSSRLKKWIEGVQMRSQ